MQKILTEKELLDENTLEIEWPERLESEMSDQYDDYELILRNEEDDQDPFTYSNETYPEFPEYYRVH